MKNDVNDDLSKKNARLKKKVDKFSMIACTLTKGKENLDMILGYQRQSLSKHGLGFNPFLS